MHEKQKKNIAQLDILIQKLIFVYTYTISALIENKYKIHNNPVLFMINA